MDSKKDHDLLIEINENVRHLVEGFKSHLDEDKKSFKEIGDRVRVLERAFWSCAGATILLQIFFKIVR